MRRRQGGMSRSATFKEEKNLPPDEGEWVATSSLAAQALLPAKGGPTYDYTSMGSSNETGSFWGVLARKAKAILEDDNMQQSDQLLTQARTDHFFSPRAPNQVQSQNEMISKKLDTPTPASLSSSMMDNLGKTLEGAGGLPYVENKESRNKIEIVRKGVNEGTQVVYAGDQSPLHKPMQSKNPTSQEDQLKASRDVAMATAAKAKLLLRELKTIRADLAFAKQRCSELEEENKILRDAREEKGLNPADDDMIRRQLETLLAEKARLAHENSVYARENRVLREIVEYHQMTTQDVIYFDEATEEVTPVFSSISMPDSPTSSPPPAYLFRSASAHVPLPTPHH